MEEVKNQSINIRVSSILRGLMIALLLLIIGNLLLGLIINFTNLANSSSNRILFIINYVAVFIGGVISAFSAGGKGWINGGLVGVVYMVIIILLGTLWNPFFFSLELVIRIVIGFLVSALGGVVGVNLV